MAKTVDLTNPIFTDPDAARTHFEAIRWPDGPYCPFCGVTDRVAPLGGKSMGAGWYHCRDCRRKFTAAVGTIYERSHIPITKWLLATHLMCASKKGMSAHQLHRMLGLPYKTAWFMAHRIREAMRDGSLSPLGGVGKVVEADETYFGQRENFLPGSQRGDRPYKKRKMASKRAGVALVERGGEARMFHVDRATKAAVTKIVTENVERETYLHTDESRLYGDADQLFAEHRTVKHSVAEYVRDTVHTNTVESVFSVFKRGMKGVYQHCSEKHLHRYLAEFDFRHNARAALNVTDAARATKAIRGAVGKRLTYQQPLG